MMSWRRGKAYAQDLRDRVLAATGRGGFGKSLSALVCLRRMCRGCVRAMDDSAKPAQGRSTIMCHCAWPL